MVAKVDLILLSIIIEKPMHGYEVEQAINERHIRKWAAIGTSSIYAGLDRLEKKGLAKSQLDTSEGLPARRVFTITNEGKQLLKEGATSLLRKGEYIYLDFSVGMVALPYLDRADVVSYARERLAEMESYVADAENHRAEPDGSIPLHAYWLWKHQYDLLRTEVAWLQDFIDSTESREEETEH